MSNRIALHFAPQDKLTLHPQFARYMAGERVYPINVEISPSGICSASCIFCFYANTGELGSHRNVMLDRTALQNVLWEMKQLGVKSVSWTGGGEPSLYPHIGEVVELAAQYGLEQGIFTNALSMPKYNPALMQWVRITMTDKPYKPECIRPLRAAKTLGFAFNYAGPQDDDYMRQTLALAEDVGADYCQVRPALKFHGQTVSIEPPTWEHPLMIIANYKFEEAKKKHGYTTCEGYKFIPMIWETGEVAVCSYMRLHDGYMLGSIYEKTLKQILDEAPPHVPVIEQCQVCCKNHEINKRIHESRLIQDANFP